MIIIDKVKRSRAFLADHWGKKIEKNYNERETKSERIGHLIACCI